MAFDRIAVVGAGAWGTALANTAARAGRDVMLWARDAAMVAQLTTERENPRLPGIRLDDRIAATGGSVSVSTESEQSAGREKNQCTRHTGARLAVLSRYFHDQPPSRPADYIS